MAKYLRQRITVLAVLALLFFLVYGVSRHYSPALVAYVVEQTLTEKAPEGMSSEAVRKRFEAVMFSAAPKDKMLKLMSLSNYLEKVQKLTPNELDELLGPATAASR